MWRLSLVLLLAACGRDQDSGLATKIAAAAARLPGLQITVEYRGDVILDGAYGFADVENRAPVTADTVFCIGSVSKQFGAAAILQLAEAGKLSLTDPLSTYFPDFPRGERITIEHLLRHTSGIADFEYSGPWPPVMAIARSMPEMIAMVRDRPPHFEPGTQFAYSTTNYILLGEIIAKVSGQPLADYMREHVYARAKLEHTRFCDTYALIPNRAQGYDTKDGALVPTALQMREQFSVGGGICSTTHDLLRWQHALERGEVVSAASYQQMITAKPVADGTPTGYGLGLFPSQVAGHRTISHEGNVSGFTSGLYHFVDDDLRIAAITNHRNMMPPWFPVADAVLGFGTAKPAAASALAGYTATVRLHGEGEYRIAPDGDHLAFVAVWQGEVSPPLALVQTGTGTFESPDRRITIVFDAATRIAEVRVVGMSMFARY